MKVFYQSKLSKWLLWQGYSTITLGCFVFSMLSREEMPKRVLNHEAIDGYLDVREPFEFVRYYGRI